MYGKHTCGRLSFAITYYRFTWVAVTFISHTLFLVIYCVFSAVCVYVFVWVTVWVWVGLCVCVLIILVLGMWRCGGDHLSHTLTPMVGDCNTNWNNTREWIFIGTIFSFNHKSHHYHHNYISPGRSLLTSINLNTSLLWKALTTVNSEQSLKVTYCLNMVILPFYLPRRCKEIIS